MKKCAVFLLLLLLACGGDDGPTDPKEVNLPLGGIWSWEQNLWYLNLEDPAGASGVQTLTSIEMFVTEVTSEDTDGFTASGTGTLWVTSVVDSAKTWGDSSLPSALYGWCNMVAFFKGWDEWTTEWNCGDYHFVDNCPAQLFVTRQGDELFGTMTLCGVLPEDFRGQYQDGKARVRFLREFIGFHCDDTDPCDVVFGIED